MSVERRAITRRELTFEGGLKLPRGTIVYVEETENGTLGTFYPDPLKHSAHAFHLSPDDYSVLTRADTAIEEFVVLPTPPEPMEVEEQRREMARRRLRARIRTYREEADRLERELETMEVHE